MLQVVSSANQKKIKKLEISSEKAKFVTILSQMRIAKNTILIETPSVSCGGGRCNSLLINQIHKIMEKKLPYEGPLMEVVYLNVESVICSSGEDMTPGQGQW